MRYYGTDYGNELCLYGSMTYTIILPTVLARHADAPAAAPRPRRPLLLLRVHHQRVRARGVQVLLGFHLDLGATTGAGHLMRASRAPSLTGS